MPVPGGIQWNRHHREVGDGLVDPPTGLPKQILGEHAQPEVVVPEEPVPA